MKESASNVELIKSSASIPSLCDGKVVRATVSLSWNEALEAVGLPAGDVAGAHGTARGR
jgi:hypothetical protein